MKNTKKTYKKNNEKIIENIIFVLTIIFFVWLAVSIAEIWSHQYFAEPSTYSAWNFFEIGLKYISK